MDAGHSAIIIVFMMSAFLVHNAVKGIRTGKIMWRDDESPRLDRMVFRDEEPFMFWFTVMINLVIGISLTVVVLWAALRR